jgi:hypothetical protein
MRTFAVEASFEKQLRGRKTLPPAWLSWPPSPARCS